MPAPSPSDPPLRFLHLKRHGSALRRMHRQSGWSLASSRFMPTWLEQSVIGDHRRYRREQADRGGEQCLRNARRDHRPALLFCSRPRSSVKAAHDAPYRAEQADEGGHRAHRRQHVQPVGQTVDLGRDAGDPIAVASRVARALAIDRLAAALSIGAIRQRPAVNSLAAGTCPALPGALAWNRSMSSAFPEITLERPVRRVERGAGPA